MVCTIRPFDLLIKKKKINFQSFLFNDLSTVNFVFQNASFLFFRIENNKLVAFWEQLQIL